MSRNRRLVRRRFVLPSALLASSLGLVVLGLAACGVDGDNLPLPYFTGEAGLSNFVEGGSETSTTGDGGAETSTSNDGAPNDSATDGAPQGDGGSGTLLISQVQSRGAGGGNDEFIEIYNASSSPVTFDSAWSVTMRGAASVTTATCATASSSTLYTGAGQVIASHKHLLLAPSGYSGSTAADAPFSAGIQDAASIVLVHSLATVDALCFSYDTATTTTLTTCAVAYTCEGAPATNPHDNTTGTNVNRSLERKPGGTGGNATDTNVNAADFSTTTAADPHDLASAATP